MRKFKRITSIILATLMVMSLFAAVPMTVNAAPPGGGGGGIVIPSKTITLYANNGTDQSYSNSNTVGAQIIADPSVFGFTTPENKMFSSWNTQQDGTGTDYGSNFSYSYDSDLTLYAQWVTIYTVTWKNEDGTTLETDENVEEGTTPTYDGETPVKDPDGKYVYTFSGWSPEVTTVTGDVTYTAKFDRLIMSNALQEGDVIDAGTTIRFACIYNTSRQVYSPLSLEIYLDSVNEGDEPIKRVVTTEESQTEPDRYYTTTQKCVVSSYDYTPRPTSHVLYLKSLYTVTWKDADGSVLKTEDVAKGDTPSYGTDPTKEEDAENTYTFAGWSPEITAVTGDATYTAQFDATPKPKKLTLNVGENGKVVMDNGTFGNATDANNIVEVPAPINVADGSKIFIVDGRSANLVEGGSINIATGGEVSLYPSADNTGKITAIPDEGYALYGWYDGDTLYSEDTVLAYQNIDKTTTLTAVFAPAHTVTWKDAGGTILRTDTIAEGKTPSYGSTPTKANDDYHSYNFSGWTDGTNTYGASDTLPAVTGDVTYTAKYTVFTKQFTVFVKTTTGKTITANGVSGDTTVTELKDMVVEESGIPAAEQRLIFAGKEMENEKTLADYRIQKESTLHVVGKSYTITWKNDDGTVIDTTSVAYGTTPTYDGETPYKADGANCIYTFSGWTPEVSAVTGDATYTATFTESEKPEVIKDCTYKYNDAKIYSNVPFMENESDLLDGAITGYIPFPGGFAVINDTKGYSYKFYDQTGTEIPATISSKEGKAGNAGFGLSADDIVYETIFSYTMPNDIKALYIVATAPAPTYDYTTDDNDGYYFNDPLNVGVGDTLATLNGYSSLFNFKILGVQKKSDVDVLSSDSKKDVRFVSVINTEILKDADEYGYVFAKFDSKEDARAHADEIQAYGDNVLTKECTTTSNTISGNYGLYNEDTNYKYVTATVNGIGDDTVAARFYIKKGSTYYYADYTNDQNQTYGVCAAAYSDLT